LPRLHYQNPQARGAPAGGAPRVTGVTDRRAAGW